jgi:DNA-binding MarR family transcriptional regulator
VNTSEIRRFRSYLRQFERVTHLHLKTCCAGVTLAQCLVLLEVEEHGRPTVGQLASRLRLDDSTLSRTIEGLVKKGLLKRQRDTADRRVVWTRLTPEGKAVCRSIHKDNDAWCRRVFRNVPSSKRATVIRNFEIVVQAFVDGEADGKESSS